VTVILNCGAYVWVLTPDGSAMLRTMIEEVARTGENL